MYVKIFEAPKDLGSNKRKGRPDTIRKRVPSGQPPASVMVASGEWVSVLVRWHDCFDIPETACSIIMSREEARKFAEQLLSAADTSRPSEGTASGT